ncbi:unnamed protein product [Strongylus vulgaris]|uniref:Uncharacterized protein n=1 Tax=Strongylus vulgaris TaxID=40348 RepID=A0A3P7ILY5_STRVU|nr:unnamed protein product [Strongylus vulgaris]
MRAATAPGPDHVSVDLLRDGGHRLHETVEEHLTSYSKGKDLRLNYRSNTRAERALQALHVDYRSHIKDTG